MITSTACGRLTSNPSPSPQTGSGAVQGGALDGSMAKGVTMSESGVSRAALVVSVIALLASGASIWIQQRDSQTQTAALVAARQQFADSGAKFNADGRLKILDGNAGEWLDDVEKGANAEYESTSAPKTVWAIVTVTNIGRTDGAIAGVGVKTSESASIEVVPNCEGPNEKTEACRLPAAVNVGQSLKLYIPLGNALQSLTCNKYVEQQGVVITIKESAGQSVVSRTGSGLALAGFCASLPAAPSS